jgi:hypothetical protein
MGDGESVGEMPARAWVGGIERNDGNGGFFDMGGRVGLWIVKLNRTNLQLVH